MLIVSYVWITSLYDIKFLINNVHHSICLTHRQNIFINMLFQSTEFCVSSSSLECLPKFMWRREMGGWYLRILELKKLSSWGNWFYEYIIIWDWRIKREKLSTVFTCLCYYSCDMHGRLWLLSLYCVNSKF